MTQISLSLKGDQLSKGIYTVSAIQFDNDDPSSKVIQYVEAKYQIK